MSNGHRVPFAVTTTQIWRLEVPSSFSWQPYTPSVTPFSAAVLVVEVPAMGAVCYFQHRVYAQRTIRFTDTELVVLCESLLHHAKSVHQILCPTKLMMLRMPGRFSLAQTPTCC
jgi:hypothetical protein